MTNDKIHFGVALGQINDGFGLIAGLSIVTIINGYDKSRIVSQKCIICPTRTSLSKRKGV